MNENSGLLVFWILLPLFVLVGLYLIWYSRRRKKMLEAFANGRQLPFRPEYEDQLERTLDRCFSLKGDNLVRSFDQLSSIIDAGSVWLFRAVELLDLNPYARPQSTHFARIVALFEVSTEHEEFFVLDKSMQPRQQLPGSDRPSSELVEIVQHLIETCNGRHALSITFANRHGLIYFEPLVTGGETMDDVNSLYCIASKMREELTGDA